MTGPSKPEYGPRPIEEQTWRRHHRQIPQASAGRSLTSGTTRRRRKAIARRAWVTELRRKALGLA